MAMDKDKPEHGDEKIKHHDVNNEKLRAEQNYNEPRFVRTSCQRRVESQRRLVA